MTFVIIAHRGWRCKCPENTIAAFSAAIDNGFPHFETDVQLTKDGTCVIFHDENLERTTNSTGPLADKTFADVKDMDAGSWFSEQFVGERIPTLEQVMEQFASQAHIHLELKSKQEELPEAVAKVLEAHLPSHAAAGGAWDVPGFTITSFHLEQLQRMQGIGVNSQHLEYLKRTHNVSHLVVFNLGPTTFSTWTCDAVFQTKTASHIRVPNELLPQVRHSWLVQEITESIVTTALEAGVSQLCPRANAVTADAVTLASAANLSVRCWGVKEVSLLEKITLSGVQSATVDWPNDALDLLSELKRK